MKCGGNTMYLILVYDIIADEGGPWVSRNVFKTCKKYLVNIQKSTFEGELKESEYMKLKIELDKYIRKDKDSILVFKSRNQRWLDKEYLGVVDDKTSKFF